MLLRVPRCDVEDITNPETEWWYNVPENGHWFVKRPEGAIKLSEKDEVLYKNTLYDLAIIAEHDKANGNLVCPRCKKEYHMLEFDEEEEELRQEADHGPYECWQTHLEMGFCEVAEDDPKETTQS